MNDVAAIQGGWTQPEGADDHLGCDITEVADLLAAAARRIELLEDGVSPAALTELQRYLQVVRPTALEIGLESVDQIARQMEGLLDSIMNAGGRCSRTGLDTIARGLDVMTLLVRDLDRQRGGHPAAALEEAVDRLLEDVAHASVPRFDAPPPRLHIVRRGTPVVPPTATLERTLDLVCDVGRYTGRRLGKDVIVETAGSELVVAAHLSEAVLAPLEQLVRVSIDHGIETPAVRTATGKPSTARVEIAARLDSDYLVLEVADDGVELEIAEIRGRAESDTPVFEDDSLETGLTMGGLFEARAARTADVKVMSERGMIMDAVRRSIDDLDGFMDVYSEAGQATRIVLRIPLKLPTR